MLPTLSPTSDNIAHVSLGYPLELGNSRLCDAFRNKAAYLTHVIFSEFGSVESCRRLFAMRFCVLALKNIGKIVGSIVGFVAIEVVNVMPWWSISDEGLSDESMNAFFAVDGCGARSNVQIPVLFLVRRENFPDKDALHGSPVSSSLRDGAGNATDTPKGTGLVSLKAWYGTPFLSRFEIHSSCPVAKAVGFPRLIITDCAPNGNVQRGGEWPAAVREYANKVAHGADLLDAWGVFFARG